MVIAYRDKKVVGGVFDTFSCAASSDKRQVQTTRTTGYHKTE
jgi:hypothetical protein